MHASAFGSYKGAVVAWESKIVELCLERRIHGGSRHALNVVLQFKI